MSPIGWPRQLVVIRHPESRRNKAKEDAPFFPDDRAREDARGIGDDEDPLTTVGFFQLEKTRQALVKNFCIPDCIYHSGYTRTEETAEQIRSAYDTHTNTRIELRRSLLLRERHRGYTYDMTKEEALATFPYLEEYYGTAGSFFACPPGGESLAQVSDRVWKFLFVELRGCSAGQTVFLVTHNGVIRCLRFILEKWPLARMREFREEDRPLNCGITSYDLNESNDTLVLREFNTLFYK